MKRIYEEPKMIIVEFTDKDVIRTSGAGFEGEDEEL